MAFRLDEEEYDDEATKRKATQELRETEEIVSAAIEELRRLIRQEKTLNIPLEDESFLVRFLRPKKYYPDSTFEMMKAFFRMKSRENFILDHLSTESIRNALEDRTVQILPKRDQHGRRIMYIEMGAKWNCSKVPSLEVIRASNMLMEAIGREPRTQLHGLVFIINFDKLSLSHISQFPPKFVKTILEHGQKNSPYRIKGIHIVNNARMFNVLFKLFKQFLGTKWSQRVRSYELPDYDGAVIGQLLDCYKDKIEEENKYGYVSEEKQK